MFSGGDLKLNMSNTKEKHLDYLQNNIDRMNRCSFQMKGWTITIIAALLAICAAGIGTNHHGNYMFVLVGIVPTIVFYILDSYYLMKEKNLIKVYKIVAGISESSIDIKPLDIYPDLKEEQVRFREALKSPSELGMYIPTSLFVIAVTAILYFY